MILFFIHCYGKFPQRPSVNGLLTTLCVLYRVQRWIGEFCSFLFPFKPFTIIFILLFNSPSFRKAFYPVSLKAIEAFAIIKSDIDNIHFITKLNPFSVDSCEMDDKEGVGTGLGTGRGLSDLGVC